MLLFIIFVIIYFIFKNNENNYKNKNNHKNKNNNQNKNKNNDMNNVMDNVIDNDDSMDKNINEQVSLNNNQTINNLQNVKNNKIQHVTDKLNLSLNNNRESDVKNVEKNNVKSKKEFHKDFFKFRDKINNSSSFREDAVDKINNLSLNNNSNMKIKDIYNKITEAPINLYNQDCNNMVNFNDMNNFNNINYMSL